MPRSAVAVLCVHALLIGVVACAIPKVAHADILTFISDTIDDSRPATSTNHTIQFTTSGAIPASGTIVITPELGAFSIPASMDYGDFDLATSSGSSFADRSLAASQSAVNDGVAVNTGTGVITLTLNSTYGIPAGAIIRIKMGTNAVVGQTGVNMPSNPSIAASYRIDIETRNNTNTRLAFAKTMIAIVNPVGVTGTPPNNPPIRFNGLPSGIIPANSGPIEVSLNTDKISTCRYATSTGIMYDNMTNSFTALDGGLTHVVTLTGFQNSTTYTYYARCKDQSFNTNPDDFVISFTLGAPSISNNSVVHEDLGRGGSGDFPNGVSTLYLSSITISGLTSPHSTVTVLKDGVTSGTTPADVDGIFSYTVTQLERGAYTILAYSTDTAGRKSATYSSTLSVTQGTNNAITNVVLPPTLEIVTKNVGLNDTVQVAGQTTPTTLVEMLVTPQGSDTGSKKFTASSTVSGPWEISFSSGDFSAGTYEVKARAVINKNESSDYSGVQFLGIGQSASAPSGSCDLNGDSKINLVDFSILLTHWNTTDVTGDCNSDGHVNLADFSIMLYNWTG